MNKSVTKFCKICQIKVEEGVSTDSLRDTHQHLTQSSVTCDQCLTQVTDKQELKQLQLKHEENNSKQSNNNFNMICVKEEPGVEKIKEEFNVGLIKDDVCESQVTKDDFLANINNEKLPEMYYCHDCGCCTNTKRKLIIHIHKQHRKKDVIKDRMHKHTYECDQCGFKSNNRSGWNYHQLTHTNVKLFKCTQCNYACREARGLRNHMYRHSGNYPFQCDKCNYKSSSISNFNIHKLTHTDEKPFKCTQCNFASKRSYGLKVHMSQHNGKFRFQCDKCDYKCVLRSKFELHTLSRHRYEKPFECDKCDYKCTQRSSLKRHKFSHSGEKPYRCTQCNYTTVETTRLKSHMYQHYGEKPFQCDECDFKTAIKYSLKKHKLSHTNKKPHE